MTDTYIATLDRIVDDTTAVLLLEEDGRTVDELTIDVERLPAEGRHDGAVFEVELADDSLQDVTYRPEAERERRERLQDRFDRLSERLSDDDG